MAGYTHTVSCCVSHSRFPSSPENTQVEHHLASYISQGIATGCWHMVLAYLLLVAGSFLLDRQVLPWCLLDLLPQSGMLSFVSSNHAEIKNPLLINPND